MRNNLDLSNKKMSLRALLFSLFSVPKAKGNWCFAEIVVIKGFASYFADDFIEFLLIWCFLSWESQKIGDFRLIYHIFSFFEGLRSFLLFLMILDLGLS